MTLLIGVFFRGTKKMQSLEPRGNCLISQLTNAEKKGELRGQFPKPSSVCLKISF